jgi:Histidine kinase
MNLKMIESASRTTHGPESATVSRIGILGPLTVCSIAGALTVIVANECHHAVSGHVGNPPYLPSLLYGVTSWCWWAVYAFALWGAAVRRPAILAFRLKTVCLHVAAACLIAYAHLSLLQHVVWWASAIWPVWGKGIDGYVVLTLWRYGVDVAVYGCVYGFAGFLFAQIQAQKAAIQKLALERQLSEAQLKVLQMQMEPHFLFNTLNAIISLMVQGRNDEAIKTMTHLSDFLRTALERKAPEKVPFAEELSMVDNYLAIQRARFAGRLEIKIDATDEALDGLVPCFLLQPLVENAIQHGIAPKRQGGSIETCVKRVGDKLWMQVKDDGCGAESLSTKGHGIGLQNIRERLAYFYPDSHEFRAVSPAGGGYEVTIQIPYERAKV